MNKTTLSTLAAAAALVLAPPAAPALGNDFTLSLSGPSTGVVGQPIIINATGKNPPPSEYWFPLWLHVDAIPAGVISSCPGSSQDSTQIALAAGGEYLAFAQRENVAADGSFAHPVGFTPKRPGTWLICGYTVDGITNTFATASISVNVAAAATTAPGAPPAPGAAPGARPSSVTAPRVTRARGKLICHPGRWANATGHYSYSWSIVGRQRRAATGRTLRRTRRLRGRRLICTVTASNAAGATTASSRPLRVR
jgi:hypothetical protein